MLKAPRSVVFLLICLFWGGSAFSATILYVSTYGDDAWTGSIPVPSNDDGPLATLVGARDKIRQLKGSGDPGPFEVQVRGGIYYESPTLLLYPQDSGTSAQPIIYKAYPGETPVLSGGRQLNQPVLADGGKYSVMIPEAANRQWKFRQLFIDDKRYTLARSPNQGYFYVQGIPPEAPSPYYDEPWWFCHNFIYRPGDLQNWSTLSDGDVNIRVYHLWEMCTVLLTSVNEADNTAFTETHVLWGLEPTEDLTPGGASKRYVVENAPDSLDAPGEWYLDRSTGELKIIPFDSEDLSTKTLVAPVVKNAIKCIGNSDANFFVEHIQFQGLSFRHYATPALIGGLSGGWRTHQGAAGIDSCIDIQAGRYITFEQCEISHIGTHAIEFKRGCIYNTVQQCHLYDLGGGGIYIGERIATADGYDPGNYGQTSHNTVYNNYIHDAGIIHQAAMGIVIGQSPVNVISHNEIAYLNQCGIQVGWNWDTCPTWHKYNVIEYNHIHDVGQNVSSDLGGIYTVGENLNTAIRNNIIHDVYCWAEANGKGYYPDENTDGVTFENNLTYNIGAYGLGINYCRNITVRNNIFAMSYDVSPFYFGHGGYASITNNIFYYYYGNVYSDYDDIQSAWFTQCDNNLYWRIGGKPVFFHNPFNNSNRVDFEQWKSLTGFDSNSKVADPLFTDPENGDFSFRCTANADAIGFQIIDWSQSGLEGASEWTSLPHQFDKKARYAAYYEKWPDNKFSIDGLNDSFEMTMISETPKNALVFQTIQTDTVDAIVQVSEDRAYQGSRSLKVKSDQGNLPYLEYNTYDPIIYSGEGRFTGQFFKEPGASIGIDFYSDNAGTLNRFANIDIYPTGQIASAFGNPLVVIPDSTWVRVDIDFAVGDVAKITYFLQLSTGSATLYSGTITNPNALPHNLRKIKIKSLTDNSVFYVDNLGVKKHTFTSGDYSSDRFINLKDFSLFANSFRYNQDISYFNKEAITYSRMDDLYEIAQNWLSYDNVNLMEAWYFNLPAGSVSTVFSGVKGLQAILSGQANWQGSSFYFDGANYFSVSKNDPAYALDFSDDFTVKSIVRTTQMSVGTIWSRLNTIWEPGAKQLFISDGYPTFDCGWLGDVVATQRINDGLWHEVKVVYEKEGNLLSIYIDNTLNICQQLSSDMSTANDDFDFFIGVQSELSGGGRYAYFVGDVKEITVLK